MGIIDTNQKHKIDPVERAQSALAKFYFNQGAYDSAQKMAEALMATSDDDRVRSAMTKLIVETNVKLAMHENPVKQQVEHSGGINITINSGSKEVNI